MYILNGLINFGFGEDLKMSNISFAVHQKKKYMYNGGAFRMLIQAALLHRMIEKKCLILK